jgi:hypothetical protein
MRADVKTWPAHAFASRGSRSFPHHNQDASAKDHDRSLERIDDPDPHQHETDNPPWV